MIGFLAPIDILVLDCVNCLFQLLEVGIAFSIAFELLDKDFLFFSDFPTKFKNFLIFFLEFVVLRAIDYIIICVLQHLDLLIDIFNLSVFVFDDFFHA